MNRLLPMAVLLVAVSCAPGGDEQPTPPEEDAMTLTGQLGSDTVEGGCTYLETADGTKYELTYPPGWESPIPMAMGATVTVRGEIATDMASFCMVGPIFRVTEVVSVESG